MKYSDRPSVNVVVHVEAAVPRVWELVSDISLPTRFSPELQSVAWLDGADGPVAGARFEGVNRNQMLGEWRTVSQVTEADEHRVFGWAVLSAAYLRDEAASATETPPARTPAPEQYLSSWCFEIEAEGTGTRLQQTMRLGLGRSPLTAAIENQPDREEEIIASRLDGLRAGMEATLDGIKALAEADDQSA